MADADTGRGAPLPPSFDADHYLAANPDLAIAPGEAADHYARIGRGEGRIASPLALRENLIASIADGRSVLEIGPFCNPLLRGPAIAYLDVLDADQLRERAIAIGSDPAGCPDRIDYVGGLEQVRRRFDAVISSHAIEHQPDLIHHLNEVERILEPDGQLCLIIPDKRFCLDHHIAESTIAGVLQAHREQRRLHSLASVVEHVALTTHNDSGRHWAADHGPALAADHVDRVRHAISGYQGSGGYIDVHAWYFTPDSFRAIIDTLSALGRIGLEVAGVYDSARGCNEFCAVLRLSEAAREAARTRRSDDDIVVLQTSDADRYAPMLAITSANVREYCRRHGLGYESFLGIKRGFHPWQATFNRIPMLVELAERGFTGWALYLDADAYIEDLDFDLAAYLADKRDRAAILADSGVTGQPWDVNAGVMLVNFGHPQGRALVDAWAAAFARHSDDDLRTGEAWFGAGNDQDLLHKILEHDRAIAAAVLIEPPAFINGPQSTFIRQQLTARYPRFGERMRVLREAVADIFRRDGQPADAGKSSADERWDTRLAHRDAMQVRLVEAAMPAPRPDLIPAIRAAWVETAPDADPLWRDFADALSRGDDDAAAAEMAGLGRSPIATGFLGGTRQHERARSRPFADRLARWTYDKLVSLAEAVGVLPLENPENGDWGLNGVAEPADLFRDVQAALDADLRPPAAIGGYLGIDVGGGVILHMRMLDSIHAAWRLRQLAGTLGLGAGARIAEVGAGAGLTAFYAARLGIGSYRLFDRPQLAAVQSYMLEGSGHAVSRHGQTPGMLSLLPTDAFAALEPGSVDILFNADSLPAMGDAGITHFADARRLGIRHVLSINQEAALPGQTSVAESMRRAGGYRLASRHRHWLRVGYVEEHYVGVDLR